ncbi:MAG: betaine--homocysteine S-methyltransferase, partial [Kiloniellaceae bacterium]
AHAGARQEGDVTPMSDLLQRLLAARPWLLADGATGTNFFAAGLQTGDAPELWNLDRPGKVLAQMRAFVESGSDIILTNSFGGTRNRLKLHKAEDRVGKINRTAARLARDAAGAAGREVVVAGSMGPTGELFMPLGPLTMAEATAAFAEQAKALAEGGADVLWIETISSVEELTAAVTGARSTGLPVVCTLSFDTNGRTMMGVTPAQVAGLARELNPRPVAYGGNCGIGPAELLAALLGLREAAAPGDVLVAKSNCGVPEYVDGSIRYQGTPELMADYARLARDAGARIIGGCCGTTPDHIAAMRRALTGHEPGPRPSLETIIARLGQVSSGARQQQSGEGPLTARPERDAEGIRRRRGRARGRGSTTPRF